MSIGTLIDRQKLAGDIWGGLAAMLVALPSAIAFGVTVYAAIGPAYAGIGALAGMLGATALGLVAPAFGGTNRLITAPCAPAAAVLSGFAIELLHQGAAPPSIVLLLTVLGLLTGAVQVVIATAGLGGLIKYIPYPVVSGYLSGVGLVIIGSQVPKFLGAPSGSNWWQTLISPDRWNGFGIAVGVATILVTVLAPKVTQRIPAAILGLLAGVLTYFGLALLDGSLLVVEGNRLIIGPLSGETGSLLDAIVGRWRDIGELRLGEIGALFGPAITLAVLLSIDTLKTCVVLDAMTRSRHDSDRELTAQGLANMASACIGGMQGAGQMGATLVNLTSGAETRLSGVLEGVFALVAFALLGALVAWIPVASLAGILILVGVRMIDRHSLHLLTSPWTVLDFLVILAVVGTAVSVSLIAASGVGIALAMLLFIREQLSSTVIRHKSYGNQTFSKQKRSRSEMRLLERRGRAWMILELQGSLFFGTKDQLYSALEPEFGKCKYFILNMRRVQGVDVSAAHALTQIRDSIGEAGGFLIFTDIPQSLPNGRDIAAFFDQMEITTFTSQVKVFPAANDALEWVENQVLGEERPEPPAETLLELHEMDIFKERKEETLTDLEACLERRFCKAGEHVFSTGDAGDELFLIRRGSVRILLPVEGAASYHLTTFGRGDFFGGTSFLDGQPRMVDAVAFTDIDLFVLRREEFERLAEEHKRLAANLLQAMAQVLAMRLRYSDMEVAALRA